MRILPSRVPAALLALLLLGLPGTSGAAEVRVELSGLSKEMRANALAFLDLAELEEEGKVQEGDILRAVDAAPEQLQRALAPFGHYRPTVDLRLDREDEPWVASIRIEPGPPLRVDTLSVSVTGEGADDDVFQELIRDARPRVGDVLRHDVYESYKASFLNRALGRGYLEGRFLTSVVRADLERYAATVELRFDTGRRFRYGDVRFEQDVLDPELLRGYARMKRGDPVDPDDLLALQRALGESPYFRRVEVDYRLERSTDGILPIEVALDPMNPVQFNAGAGYGTDTGPYGSLGIDVRRLNRGGHQARFDLLVSARERDVAVQYGIPWAYPRTERLTFQAGYSDRTVESVDSRALRVGATLARMRGSWRETIALRFVREEYQVGVDEGIGTFLAPELSWSRTSADNLIRPRSGGKVELTLRAARAEVVSDETFHQSRLELARIVSPFTGQRTILRAHLGLTETGAFRRLPPSERFFAGGTRSVRGFAYQELGPVDRQGTVIGGRALLVGSLEHELALSGNWGLAAFVDAGNAFDDFDDEELEVGIGVGPRWYSPVGPVRLDAAWAVTRDGTPLRVHLGIGPDL